VAAGIPINRTITVGEPPADAQRRYTGHFSLWFGKGGYFEEAQTTDTVTYGRRQFHTWQIVVAVLGFPIGLIGLFAEKAHYWVTASFSSAGDASTTILLTGVVPPNVAGQLADRLDEFDPSAPREPTPEPEPTEAAATA
jgi:hypothetical protein